MRIIGIDPGTLNMGYGIINFDDDKIELVTHGVFKLSSKDSIEDRLGKLFDLLLSIIDIYKPEEAAIEEPFVAGNVKSALSIGRAQTVAIIASVIKKLPINRYSPLQVKLQVTNYGASSKRQVSEMVRIHLGLEKCIAEEDASDALAVAICHLNLRHVSNLVARNSID